MENEFIVTDSPWPNELPNGTIVIDDGGGWFKRKDGIMLFPTGFDMGFDERGGLFKLLNHQIEPIKKLGC